ncbi:hypothetical protein [Mesorhizobium sp. KR1-2]|uniref:hypothetical protein n=1 Tax=Mesorhizobium sp. KR1-2 TaxID=3156609 RepID=UPI0032B3E4E5
MTPAERARLIDKQEFEAECRAVRERVYARLDAKRTADRAHVQGTMAIPVEPAFVKRPAEAKPAAPTPPHMPKRVGQPHTVAGRSLTRRQWAEELGITYNAINQMVHRFGSVEAVVIRRLGGCDQ